MTTGIIIPDMYMPDCCWDCPLYVRFDGKTDTGWCYALVKNRNRQSNPTLFSALRIAKALDIPLSYLTEGMVE